MVSLISHVFLQHKDCQTLGYPPMDSLQVTSLCWHPENDGLLAYLGAFRRAKGLPEAPGGLSYLWDALQ